MRMDWVNPGNNAYDRLMHTLAVHMISADEDGRPFNRDKFAVIATQNIEGLDPTTGLTWADLIALREIVFFYTHLLDKMAERRPELEDFIIASQTAATKILDKTYDSLGEL